MFLNKHAFCLSMVETADPYHHVSKRKRVFLNL